MIKEHGRPRNFKVLTCKICNDTATVRQDLVDGRVCDNCGSDKMMIFPGDTHLQKE